MQLALSFLSRSEHPVTDVRAYIVTLADFPQCYRYRAGSRCSVLLLSASFVPLAAFELDGAGKSFTL
jgi:hypothetical protein